MFADAKVPLLSRIDSRAGLVNSRQTFVRRAGHGGNWSPVRPGSMRPPPAPRAGHARARILSRRVHNMLPLNLSAHAKTGRLATTNTNASVAWDAKFCGKQITVPQARPSPAGLPTTLSLSQLVFLLGVSGSRISQLTTDGVVAPGECFGFAMASCLARKKSPALGWASLGKRTEGTSSPKDQPARYALPCVSVVMQVTRWSGYAPRKRAQPLDCAQ
jgi:hypothetical protein